jgi:anti-sigma regulatory factor (Ser/Thr protein kinase)
MKFEHSGEAKEDAKIFEESFSWDNDPENAERAAEMTKEELVRLGWPEEAAYKFSLAVAEAVANATIHGNLGIDKKDGEDNYEERIRKAQEENEAKRVKVYFRFTKEEATAQIKDEGKFIPPKEMIDPTEGDNLLKSSGRGFLIIFDGTDNVEFLEGETILHKQNQQGDR